MAKEKIKKLTSLSDEEAKNFLKKYERIIFLETHKRTKLQWIPPEDIMQMCRIKLLAGFSSFDDNYSSEKTWASHVIRNTIDGVWKNYFRKKRVNHLKNNEEEEYPVRDLSFSENIINFISNDERPVFGTELSNPEEYLKVLEALKFLKANLSEKSYNLIRETILSDLEEKIPKEKKNKNIKIKKSTEYEVVTPFSGLEEKEVQILSQIADIFINILGFNKNQIKRRTKTIDISI